MKVLNVFFVFASFVFSEYSSAQVQSKLACYKDLFNPSLNANTFLSLKRPIILKPKHKDYQEYHDANVCLDPIDKDGNCYCLIFLPKAYAGTPISFENGSSIQISSAMKIKVESDESRSIAFSISATPKVSGITVKSPIEFRVNCNSTDNPDTLQQEQAAYDIVDEYLKDSIRFPEVEDSKDPKHFSATCKDDLPASALKDPPKKESAQSAKP